MCLYKHLLSETVRRHGNHLKLLVYADEVTPGNPLQPDIARKYWAIYVGIKEFGSARLANSALWLPIAFLRSVPSKKIIGGFSNCMRMLFRAWFVAPLQVHTNGIVIDLRDGPTVVTFESHRLIMDADAYRACLSIKGANGTRCCAKCRNVLSLNHRGTVDDTYLVDASCTDIKKFDKCTDQDYVDNYDRLIAAKAAGVSNAKFEELEMATGITFNSYCVFLDAVIMMLVKPITSITYDWLHIFYVGGLANHDLFFLFKLIRKTLKIKFKDLHAFVSAEWSLPGFISGSVKIAELFSDARERSMDAAGGMKASASELITALPYIRHFMETIVMPRANAKLQQAVATFLALCDLNDVIMKAKKGLFLCVKHMAGLMRKAINTYTRLRIATWDKSTCKPKFHFLFHLAEQFLRDGCIWDTFALERKHKISKCYAEAVTNFRCFDKSVNLRTLLENRRQLQELRVNSCLLGETCMAPSLAVEIGEPSVEVAHKLDWQGAIFNVGDVLLLRGSFFCVQACLDYGSLGLLCSMFSVVGNKSPVSTILREVEGEQALLDLDACGQIIVASSWCVKDDGSWLVLRPRC